MSRQRLCLSISGIVQGVGFRPFIYRLAQELNLTGWARNNNQGVEIEVEGDIASIDRFLERLQQDKPLHSQIYQIRTEWQAPLNYSSFSLQDSRIQQSGDLSILPDLATCPDCLGELFDPQNRRYHYPFLNCTACGPRYTIIESLPYDRERTTMRNFVMCTDCQNEYEDPSSRRFHAQPNACPECGPSLELWNRHSLLATGEKAWQDTVRAILDGAIIAMKGLGGFQLLADANNPATIKKLRERKQRPDKPFALLYPNLESIRKDCLVSPQEAELLQSAAAPIVLLSPLKKVLTSYPSLGAMLPYTPVHHLIMSQLSGPIVATSGNLSEEPICCREEEAISRLGKIADLFLVHNRPIVQPLDDSVVRVMDGKPTVLRRARGYAPSPLVIKEKKATRKVIAYGGQEKNTIALALDNLIASSGHIGDLDNLATFQHYQQSLERLQQLYQFKPEMVVCDAHPEYISSQQAHQSGIPVLSVQHHFAHILSCIAENETDLPILGIAWDGSGYGPDGTIWGGEFLIVNSYQDWQRVAHLRKFPLPGGEVAIKEPRRSAFGILWESGLLERNKLENFTQEEKRIMNSMLKKKINTISTSSMGRLFDAVASILNLAQKITFSGQAAMLLESLCSETTFNGTYPFSIEKDGQIDWQPMLEEILTDQNRGIAAAQISRSFHNSLAEMILAVAKMVNLPQVLLTGGCFQNRYLLEKSIQLLRAENFQVYRHQQIPPNDGGIAIGQAMLAR
jgi:hydrogenase maturation protein HypF